MLAFPFQTKVYATYTTTKLNPDYNQQKQVKIKEHVPKQNLIQKIKLTKENQVKIKEINLWRSL